MSMIINPFRFGGAAPSPEARYWRVFVEMNQASVLAADNMFVGAATVEFRSSIGGSNLATDTTKVAASGEFSSGGFGPANAVDGNGSTAWVSSGTGFRTVWLSYDFTTPVTINEILWAKRAATNGDQESPVIGVLQYSSNNSTWTGDWSFLTTPDWPSGSTAQSRVFSRPSTLVRKYWRIVVNAVQGGSGNPFAASNLEFRETAGGADATSGGQAFSSRPLAGYPASNAFDGTTSFFHSNENLSIVTPWLGYAFASGITINEVAIQMRADGFGGRANQAPTDVSVQSSLDFVTWANEWNFTTPATWSGTETRVFTRP